MRKQALISVSDKTGVVDFAKGLVAAGYHILSTGGTAKLLAEQGIGLWYNRRSRSKETSIPKLLGAIGYPTSSPELISASAYAFCRRFLPTLTQIDKDIQHLVNNPVPPHHILDSELFLRTLQAVALSFNPPQA